MTGDVKAWAHVTFNGRGSARVEQGSNVASCEVSVTDQMSGASELVCTLATPLANAGYCVVASANVTDGGVGISVCERTDGGRRTPSKFHLVAYDLGSNPGLADLANVPNRQFSFVVLGT